MKKLLLVFCNISLLITIAAAVAFASDESVFKNMEMKIYPLPHKVAVGFPHDMSGDYYFVKSISGIFFQEAPLVAKIIEVDISENEMKIVLESKKYGKGDVKFYTTKNFKDISNEELKLVLQRSLSEEKLASVVLDIKTKIYHLATCNHLPPIGNRAYITSANKYMNLCQFML